MKSTLFIMMFLFAFALVAMAGPVVTVDFVSGDGSATSSTGSTYVIVPHPEWGPVSGAQWVSAYAGTGYGGGVTLPNSDGVTPSMTFTQTFNLPHLYNDGVGTFGADDTMGIWLNGQLVKAPNFTTDGVCSGPEPIGCQAGEFLVASLAPFLVTGVNVLKMDIYQNWGSVTGAIWNVSLTSTVPEPGSFVALFGGLTGIGLAIRRRRRL